MQRFAVAFCALLVCCAAVSAVAAPAWAEEEPGQENAPGKVAAEKDLSLESVENVLMNDPLTRWTLLLGKYVPLVIGLVLLVLWYVRHDKVRAGILPPPAPVEPTVVCGVGTAALLFLAALVIGPIVFTLLMGGGEQGWTPDILQRLLIVGASTIPIAIVVMFRRVRLADPRPPGAARGIQVGLWTFCVASAVVIPVALLVGVVMTMFGKAPQVQELIVHVLAPENPLHPILIALYGALLAPLVEETIFRGMLYPTIKRASGGGRRGAVIGILIVSALFAAVHASWTAAAPLFALAVVINVVFEKTNSLTACIVAHAVHNTMTLVPLLLAGRNA